MRKFNKWEIIGGIVSFCFAIGVIISLVHPPSKKHYNPSNNLHSQDACIGLGIPVFPTPTDDKKHHKSKKQSDKEKWCAERSSLASQWKTTDITVTAFWVGLLGILLVGWTLIATRQATRLSKNSAKRQLRAYLNISSIAGTLGSVYYDKNKSVVLKFRNSGQTPARVLNIAYRWIGLKNEVMDAPIPDFIKDRIVHDWKPANMNKTRIASGDAVECIIPIPKDIQVNNVSYLWEDKYIDIKFRYKDVYDDVWECDFLLESIELGTPKEVHATERKIT